MRVIKFYDFDLDKPASDRWCEIFDANAALLVQLSGELRSILEQFGMASVFVKPFYQLISEKNILYYDEILYIAGRIGLTPFETLLLQLVYETSSACTAAIIKVGTKDLFFRTMDWPLMFLKDATIGLNIQSKGKNIGKVTTWLGYVGFLTATNTIDNYTIAINYRRTKEISFSALIANFYRTVNMKWPVGYLVRHIIENNLNIVETKIMLETAQLISPCYVTLYISGYESYIITRDCDNLVNTRFNELIQTNCDWNKTEPNILWSLERIKTIKNVQKKIDQCNIMPSHYEILNWLLKYPVKNEETIYVHYQYDGINETLV